jgi:hypothetical protein
MIPRHASLTARAELAPAAALERDERARIYPKRIAAGAIAAEAAHADRWAWTVIVEWLEGATSPMLGRDVGWPDLEVAAARALRAGEAAAAKAPQDPATGQRRDTLAEIHAMVAAHRAFLDAVNAALRRQTGRIAA